MNELGPPRLQHNPEALTDSERAELHDYGSEGPAHAAQLRMLSRLEQTIGSEAGAGHAGPNVRGVPWLALAATGLMLVLGVGLWLLTRTSAAPALELAPQSASATERTAPAAPAPVEAAEAAPLEAERPAKARSARKPRLATPRDELALLARARRSLLSRPAEALALAEEHARDHPHGALEEEREVLAIEALQKLGRVGAARRRIGIFLRRFPKSSQRANLSAWLASTQAAP
jgi:hypothetical protein